MDIRNQLRKYKIQLNELEKGKELALEREKNIYTSELDRINAKLEEYMNECRDKINNLSTEKMQLLEDLENQNKYMIKLQTELETLADDKFKLRSELLKKIHHENTIKKDIKKNKSIFNSQLENIKQQINEQRQQLDNYNNKRRQINEDYYNWRDEINDIQEKINKLSVDDKKKSLLEDYLKELDNDPRSNTNKRYEDLDEQKSSALKLIEQLEYQYTKIETYMNRVNNNSCSQPLIISSHLQKSKTRIPELKNIISATEKLINNFKQEITQKDTEINILHATDTPNFINEQRHKAEKRLNISTKRINSEFDPLIDNIKTDIDTILKTQNTNLDTVNVNSGSDNTTNDGSNSVNIVGKSRKELERLRKLIK